MVSRLINWVDNPRVANAVRCYDKNDVDTKNIIELGGSVTAAFAAILEDELMASNKRISELEHMIGTHDQAVTDEIYLFRYIGSEYYVYMSGSALSFVTSCLFHAKSRDQFLDALDKFRTTFNNQISLTSGSLKWISDHE